MYSDRVDLLAAGVPCQPFSLGGKHKGHRDDRNMFPEVTRAIRAVRPKLVIVENVKGLLRTKFQEYFEYVLLSLRMPELAPESREAWWEHATRLRAAAEFGSYRGLVYDVSYQLINCADYGVPQLRERVFLLGMRSDIDVSCRPIEPTHSVDALLWDQWVDGSYWRDHGMAPKRIPSNLKNRIQRLASSGRPTSKRWLTVRDALVGLPEPSRFQENLYFDNHLLNHGARAYPGHTGSPYDWPAKALKAGVHGVPGGENTLRYSNGKVRYFTVREAARLQSFPDSYRLQGAWCECMRQLGNAVPVAVGRIMGTRAREVLNAYRRRESQFIDGRVLGSSESPMEEPRVSAF
jgi:DNA (cytosine-5)-methyltransferase 1